MVDDAPIHDMADSSVLDEVEATIERFARVRSEIGRAIFGQERVVEESLTTLLAGGHVLLVGVPGLAKTRLVETLGVVSHNGYRTVQEDEPLIEMAVKLCHAGARGAYVLRGRRLVGSVTTGEILKKIAGGR